MRCAYLQEMLGEVRRVCCVSHTVAKSARLGTWCSVRGRGFGPVLALWSCLLCVCIELRLGVAHARTAERGGNLHSIHDWCHDRHNKREMRGSGSRRLDTSRPIGPNLDAPAVCSMAWANCRFRPRGRIGAIPTTLQGGIDHSRSASRWSKLPEPFMPAEALGRTLRPAKGMPDYGQIARGHRRSA